MNTIHILRTVESHINESHIKDKSHINDVQAARKKLYLRKMSIFSKSFYDVTRCFMICGK